ncbi:DUF1707 SHOCT-like domain-containing protein [Salininema proteolyticum]|uniref:DUF1707 domain-containing protein n=1 Tax=Salininema proteolyticum TaxID=1607685 RepID=A0ABV8U1I2_9ACTN
MPDSSDRNSSLRVSDAERNEVVDRLQKALAAGYIDLGEFDERAAGAQRAKVRGDLKGLLEDIPDGEVALHADAAVMEVEERLVVKTTMGDVKKQGQWPVPGRITVKNGMGDVKLDFREAYCPHEVVEIRLDGGMGDVVIVLPDEWIATENVRSTMGDVRNKCTSSPLRARKRINVTGKTKMGDVVIRRERKFLRWRW